MLMLETGGAAVAFKSQQTASELKNLMPSIGKRPKKTRLE
jgi:hypothetical protein